MYQLTVEKYDKLTDEEKKQLEERIKRDNTYNMNRYENPIPEFTTRRVLSVNLTEEEYNSVKEGVLKNFK